MAMDQEQFKRLQPQFRRVVSEWQAKAPWIHSVGLSEKYVGGEPAGEDAIVFYVPEKMADNTLDDFEKIPERIRIPMTDVELPTDVVQMPPFRFAVSCPSARPAHGGDCVAPRGDPANVGTLGAVLRRRSDAKDFFLTASHAVLGTGTFAIGHDVCHPPGGSIIGVVDDSVAWTRLAPMPMDAALVRVDDPTAVASAIIGVPKITGTGGLLVGQTVKFKSINGAKTDRVATLQTNTVTVDGFKFENTFFLVDDEPTEPGDSGSIVVNAFGEALGVVFALNGILTSCTAIDTVIAKLNLSDFDF